MDARWRRCAHRLGRIIVQLKGIIADVEYWNSLHPAERPLDCETDRVALAIASKAKAALLAGDDGGFNRLFGDLCDYLGKVCQ
jgi:hypothetical protein